MIQKQNYWLFFVCMVLFSISCETMQSRWDKAESINTIQSYSEFLRYNPEGAFSDEARTRIEKIKFEKAQVHNTIAGYKMFLLEYPKGVLSDSARSLINNLFSKNSQTELYYDDYSVESVYFIDQIDLTDPQSLVYAQINASGLGPRTQNYWTWCLGSLGEEKNVRIAVQFKSPFDKSRLTRVFITHFLKGDNYDRSPTGFHGVEVLDENWNSIAKTTKKFDTGPPPLGGTPGILGIADINFSDSDVIVGKIFSIALDSKNMQNLGIGLDNSSSGHSYAVLKDNIQIKIEEEPDSVDFFKRYNDGKYEFMIRAVVEEIK